MVLKGHTKFQHYWSKGAREVREHKQTGGGVEVKVRYCLRNITLEPCNTFATDWNWNTHAMEHHPPAHHIRNHTMEPYLSITLGTTQWNPICPSHWEPRNGTLSVHHIGNHTMEPHLSITLGTTQWNPICPSHWEPRNGIPSIYHIGNHAMETRPSVHHTVNNAMEPHLSITLGTTQWNPICPSHWEPRNGTPSVHHIVNHAMELHLSITLGTTQWNPICPSYCEPRNGTLTTYPSYCKKKSSPRCIYSICTYPKLKGQ